MNILELMLKTLSDIKDSARVKHPTISLISAGLMDHLLFLDDSTLASLMLEARVRQYDFKSERVCTNSKYQMWTLIKNSEKEEDSLVYLLRFIALYNKPTIKPIKEIFRALEITDEVLYGV